MAAVADETVFQGEVQMAKCLSPPSEMVQGWKLGTCLGIFVVQVQALVGYVQDST